MRPHGHIRRPRTTTEASYIGSFDSIGSPAMPGAKPGEKSTMVLYFLSQNWVPSSVPVRLCSLEVGSLGRGRISDLVVRGWGLNSALLAAACFRESTELCQNNLHSISHLMGPLNHLL